MAMYTIISISVDTAKAVSEAINGISPDIIGNIRNKDIQIWLDCADLTINWDKMPKEAAVFCESTGKWQKNSSGMSQIALKGLLAQARLCHTRKILREKKEQFDRIRAASWEYKATDADLLKLRNEITQFEEAICQMICEIRPLVEHKTMPMYQKKAIHAEIGAAIAAFG